MYFTTPKPYGQQSTAYRTVSGTVPARPASSMAVLITPASERNLEDSSIHGSNNQSSRVDPANPSKQSSLSSAFKKVTVTAPPHRIGTERWMQTGMPQKGRWNSSVAVFDTPQSNEPPREFGINARPKAYSSFRDSSIKSSDNNRFQQYQQPNNTEIVNTRPVPIQIDSQRTQPNQSALDIGRNIPVRYEGVTATVPSSLSSSTYGAPHDGFHTTIHRYASDPRRPSSAVPFTEYSSSQMTAPFTSETESRQFEERSVNSGNGTVRQQHASEIPVNFDRVQTFPNRPAKQPSERHNYTSLHRVSSLRPPFFQRRTTSEADVFSSPASFIPPSPAQTPLSSTGDHSNEPSTNAMVNVARNVREELEQDPKFRQRAESTGEKGASPRRSNLTQSQSFHAPKQSPSLIQMENYLSYQQRHQSEMDLNRTSTISPATNQLNYQQIFSPDIVRNMFTGGYSQPHSQTSSESNQSVPFEAQQSQPRIPFRSPNASQDQPTTLQSSASDSVYRNVPIRTQHEPVKSSLREQPHVVMNGSFQRQTLSHGSAAVPIPPPKPQLYAISPVVTTTTTTNNDRYSTATNATNRYVTNIDINANNAINDNNQYNTSNIHNNEFHGTNTIRVKTVAANGFEGKDNQKATCAVSKDAPADEKVKSASNASGGVIPERAVFITRPRALRISFDDEGASAVHSTHVSITTTPTGILQKTTCNTNATKNGNTDDNSSYSVPDSTSAAIKPQKRVVFQCDRDREQSSQIAASEAGVLTSDASASYTASQSVLSSVNQEVPPCIRQYDDAIEEPLQRFLKLSSDIGADVKTAGEKVSLAFTQQRNFIWNAAGQKEPSQAELANKLSGLVKLLEELSAFRESKRNTPQFNHLSAVSEGIQALGWLTMKPTPAPFIKDMNEASMFFVNRVRSDNKDGDKIHSEWTKSWIELLNALQQYVRQVHTTGLVWNSNPGTFAPSSAAAIASAPVPSGTAGGPPPPPPPPPMLPPDLLSTTANPSEAGGAAGRAALFAEINRGADITKGLKKVTADMQTHKNPALRTQVPAPDDVIKSGEQHVSSKDAGKKEEVQKPAKTWLENGKQWNVEYHKNNPNIIVETTNMKQTVYVFRCENSVIQVKGKLNSITLDGCKKTSIVFDSLLSQIEVINSQGIHIQTLGTMPTLSIQKTDGCEVYLSKEAIGAEIVTSKSSGMNVLVPQGSEGDFTEFPIPEQFKTVYDGKKLQTTASDIV
ncbi:unnamed protein product [Anisakis simplex]|uniref:Adenylyl cyclase-associated protein n=1 Tax=Anisakis simplex TaxID=6269 RepID=A0A0M3JYU1_ANISI|nr:unnamed protein product [Anisakis simplex]